jgi:hypothetical protein
VDKATLVISSENWRVTHDTSIDFIALTRPYETLRSLVRYTRMLSNALCYPRLRDQEPVDIVAGGVPIACITAPWHRQDTHLLVGANGFCRDAGSACKLPNRQGSFHSRSSLCDVSGKQGTRSTGWKVKGLHRHSVKCVRGTSLLHRSSGGHTARGLRHDRDGRIVIERAAGGNASSQCGISTWAEDSRRRITATPTRLKAMDSSRTRRNEPVA